MTIHGVFFDLGGTLVSYRGGNRRTAPLLAQVVERLGIAASRETIAQAYRAASRAVMPAFAEREYYLHRDLFRAMLAGCVEQLGGRLDDDLFDWYHAQQVEASTASLAVRDDCHATLAALKARGLYLSIVSNIDDDMLLPIVRRERLDERLDHWTSSEAARSCKPHRRFFEVALAKSGLRPDQVLFVGDSPEHDIRGALDVGMRTALIVEDGIEPPLQTGRAPAEAHHRIDALAELVALVDGYRAAGR